MSCVDCDFCFVLSLYFECIPRGLSGQCGRCVRSVCAVEANEERDRDKEREICTEPCGPVQ